jgi:hypothetical protein
VLGAAVSGCFYPAYQAFQSPATLPPLHVSFGPEMGGTVGYVVDSVDYSGENPGLHRTDLVGLEFGVLARFGLARNFDVGLRLSPGLVGMVDAKYRFLSWPVNAAVGLGCSWYPRTGALFEGSDVGGVALYPVLVAGSDKFFGGLRAVVLHEVNDAPGRWRVQPGAFAGASLGRRLRFEPELSAGIVDQPGPMGRGYRRLVSAGAGLALSFRF